MKKPDAEARANEAIVARPDRFSSAACRRSCPAASSSASPLPARWYWSRRCCCLTNRCPTSTPLRRHVREEIRELQQRLKLTCVYVTHDREEAMAVSDQIIVMGKGVITEMGTPGQLFFAPRTSFVADFRPRRMCCLRR